MAGMKNKIEEEQKDFILNGIKVCIRAVKKEDIPKLKYVKDDLLKVVVTDNNGSEKTEKISLHKDRFDRQEKGEVTYLIATINDFPVGIVLIKWNGKPSAPDYPDMEDIFVIPPLRQMWIGPRLVEFAEYLCKKRGFKKIGLCVNPKDNAKVKKGYERLGYKEVDGTLYIDGRYPYIDKDGNEQIYEDWCVDMEKEI